VLKLTSSGSLDWARTFGGAGGDYAYSITQTTDGGFAVAGFTTSFGAGTYDVLVLKLNSNGSLDWARTFGFGGSNFEETHSIIQTTDGGFAVAGYTYSSLSGASDFLVLKLGADGSYPDCVQDCSPTVMSVSPSTSTPIPTTTTLSLTITDVCAPLELEERDLSGPWPGITCSPVSGGALFISPGEMPIKIYTADGRLAYSGQLQKGENRISLDEGVYLWTTHNLEPVAPNQKGKAIVR